MNPNQPLGAEGKEPGMQQELIDRLSIITEEERQILAGTGEINRSIFTAPDSDDMGGGAAAHIDHLHVFHQVLHRHGMGH